MDIKVQTSILKANDRVAQQNRELLTRHKILLLNIMASPGAGKTTFILALNQALQGRLRMGVIEGDLSSSVDADKVAAAGIPVLQINTGGGCHLEATHISKAIQNMPLDRMDLLVVENVGNLVCTAGYDLGEHLRIVISSVPEGDDKPYKYPRMFNVVDAVVVSKVDLAPHVDYCLEAFEKAVRSINETVRLFPVNARRGEGMTAFADWLACSPKR